MDPWFWARHLRQTVRVLRRDPHHSRVARSRPAGSRSRTHPDHPGTPASSSGQDSSRPADAAACQRPPLGDGDDGDRPRTAVARRRTARLGGVHRHERRRRDRAAHLSLRTSALLGRTVHRRQDVHGDHQRQTRHRRLAVGPGVEADRGGAAPAPAAARRIRGTMSALLRAQGFGASLADRLASTDTMSSACLRGPAFAKPDAAGRTRSSTPPISERLRRARGGPARRGTDAPDMVVHSWAAESGEACLSFDERQDRTLLQPPVPDPGLDGAGQPRAAGAVRGIDRRCTRSPATNASIRPRRRCSDCVRSSRRNIAGILCRTVDIDRMSERDAAFEARAMTQLDFRARCAQPGSGGGPSVMAGAGSGVTSESSVAGGDAAPSRLRNGGVYLITGGLGELGHACAAYIARRSSSHLILVGRSAPARTGALAGMARCSDEAIR